MKNKIFHTQDLCLRTNLRCAKKQRKNGGYHGIKKSESKITSTGEGPASYGYGMEGGGAFQTTDHH